MSLDPRINRVKTLEEVKPIAPHEYWPTYEVFHQKKRGLQPVHVGIVHAPSPDLALVFAKEQYARRDKSVNLWVVKSSEVYTFDSEDSDMFETTPEKTFRDGNAYKVREKVEQYKKEHNTETTEGRDGYWGGITYD